ncbi:Protein of unknown function, partial [Gryllus bimaculatus]
EQRLFFGSQLHLHSLTCNGHRESSSDVPPGEELSYLLFEMNVPSSPKHGCQPQRDCHGPSPCHGSHHRPHAHHAPPSGHHACREQRDSGAAPRRSACAGAGDSQRHDHAHGWHGHAHAHGQGQGHGTARGGGRV